MSQRACDKCGEMVNATKAFCPECGHALVEEEKRSDTTEFQNLDGTMQVGHTMFNQMLSEMGLNISVPSEQLTEAVKPVLAEVSPPAEPKPIMPPARAEVIKPLVTEKLEPAAAPAAPRSNRIILFLIIGGVVLLGWIVLVLLFAFFAILPRLR